MNLFPPIDSVGVSLSLLSDNRPPPLVRGCCRFSGLTTTAYPLRVQGEGWGGDGVKDGERTHPHPNLSLEGEGTVALPTIDSPKPYSPASQPEKTGLIK
jgi:hypothetical protein